MHGILLALSAAIALPSSVNSGRSYELHKKCLEATDYAGCVKINKKFSRKKIKKYLV